MRHNARERQALSRTASEIFATAPELAALFSTFNKVESGAEMPYRAEPAPSRAEPLCGIMAVTPRNAPMVSRPAQGHRGVLIIIVSALISVGLIVMAVVVGLADRGAACPSARRQRAQAVPPPADRRVAAGVPHRARGAGLWVT
jgi:hypothetical protein